MYASPLDKLLLLDDESVIAARIENRWDSRCSRIELTTVRFGNANPDNNLLGKDTHRLAPYVNGRVAIKKREISNNCGHVDTRGYTSWLASHSSFSAQRPT